MPFTLFHLGPALAIGLPLRKYIHTPTFILANIIIDLEPFLVIFLNLEYPLHGYVHTIVAAVPIGLVTGSIFYLLNSFLENFWSKLFLTNIKTGQNFTSFILAGVLGTILHILFDAPLYEDIKPFYPLTINPLYYPKVTDTVYNVCLGLGTIGLIFYLYLITKVSKKP